MSDDIAKAPEFVITDFDTLKVLADPLRMQIMTLLSRPRTVKELAEKLGMPPTKLYYHVNQLLRAKLIQITDTNIVSGIIEKRYAAVAEGIRVDPELLSPQSVTEEYVENVLSVVFDSAKKDIRRSVATGVLDLRADPAECLDRVVARLYVELTPAQFEEFRQRLTTWLTELQAVAAETKEKECRGHVPYGLTIGFYPLPFIDDEEST